MENRKQDNASSCPTFVKAAIKIVPSPASCHVRPSQRQALNDQRDRQRKAEFRANLKEGKLRWSDRKTDDQSASD